MKVQSLMVIFGLLALSALPAHARSHSKAKLHSKKKANAVSFDQKIAALQHHFDLDVRKNSAPVSTESMAELHHVPLSVVDDLRSQMSWGQVAVYLSVADQIALKNPTMSTTDCLDPLRANRKAGMPWHEIVKKNKLPADKVLMEIASNKLARVQLETQLAQR